MPIPVILTTTSAFDVTENPWLKRLTDQGWGIVTNPLGRRLSAEEAGDLLARHDPVGLLAGVEPLTAAVIARAPSLRVISRVGTGMDNVDLAAAAARRIKVANTPDAPTGAVAELTIGLILDALRSISRSDAALRRGGWESAQGGQLSHSTVAVVGFGRIGRRVAQLARAFGARVLAVETAPVEVPEGVTVADLATALATADVITLHLPLTPATRHLIDARALAAMKPGAVLVNAARGGLVDEAAAAAALTSGRLAAAAFDVFEQEPYRGPLADCPTAVLTAHMGSRTRETRTIMEHEAAANLVALLEESVP